MDDDQNKDASEKDLEKLFADVEPSDEQPDVVFEERPWIPPGKYDLELVSHKCGETRWGPKIFLTFRVVSGECKDVEVTRFYNATKIDDKGRPQAADGSDFKREMRTLFPGRSLRKFAWKWFKDIVIIGTIVDTGDPRNVYSKVGALKGSRPK